MNNEAIISIDTSSGNTDMELTDNFSYDIIDENEPILTRKAKVVTFDDQEEVEKVCSNLVKTAKKLKLLSLTATQCGIDMNIVVVGYDDKYVAFCNSEYDVLGDEYVDAKEMSVTEKYVAVNIKRPKHIHVRYKDFRGEEKEVNISGLTCRYFLHGYDILQGKKLIDNFSGLKRKLEIERKNKLKKKLTRLSKKYKKSLSNIAAK